MQLVVADTATASSELNSSINATSLSAWAGASTPLTDTLGESVYDSDSTAPPPEAPSTFFTLPRPVENDQASFCSQPPLTPLYSASDSCHSTQADQVGGAYAAAQRQWEPLSFSRVIRARPHPLHLPENWYNTTGSCHKCKRRPVHGAMLACISSHCSLKFCTTCLNRNHAFKEVTVLPSGRIHCPRCRKICTCKACIKRNKRQLDWGGRSQLHIAHSGTAVSLLNLSPHSPIIQSPQVVIPRELYDLLIYAAKQHISAPALIPH